MDRLGKTNDSRALARGLTSARAFAGAVAAVVAAAAVLGPATSRAADPDIAGLRAQFKRPATIPFPADNPFSIDKAALGKALYFDPRVSGGGNMTCNSCHNPSFGWSDGQAKALGALAQTLGRHSPSILNTAWGDTYFWDGRAASLEAQAVGPITAPAEMNMPMDQLVQRLKGVPGYVSWFDRVFPGQGISEKTIPQAIATFERTVVSGRAPFDAWVDGNDKAMSPAAKSGFALFTGKAGCAQCHTGWAFTDNKFHDVGMPDDDVGRGAIDGANPKAPHAFKTPGLRNIRQRAPYMHDGSLATLEAVIGHYISGGLVRPSLSPLMRPVNLSAAEQTDLLAFLDALTGDDAQTPLPVLPK